MKRTRTLAGGGVIILALGLLSVEMFRRSHGVISHGVGVTEQTMRVEAIDVRIVRVDLANARIDLHWMNPDGSPIRTLELAMKSVGDRAVFATNAGIFDKSYTPLGLHIENGRELHPLNLDAGGGNFFWKPNAVFGIRDGKPFLIRSEAFVSSADVELATQSGPMLLEHGRVFPEVAASVSSERTRSGVGITAAGEIMFILSLEPCSFATFANTFAEAGCTDAMYLDGEISRFRTNRTRDNGNFGAIFVVSTRSSN